MPHKQNIVEIKKGKSTESDLIISSNKPVSAPTKESIIAELVDLYITQVNAQFDEGSMKPSLDYANILIERSEAQPTIPGTDVYASDEGAKLHQKSERLAKITWDYYNVVAKEALESVTQKITQIVDKAYASAGNGRVNTEKIAQQTTVVIRETCDKLATKLSENLAENRDDKLLAYHQNKVVEKCNLVFKGWCTFLYTVLDLKSAIKEKSSFSERFKKNFDKVDLGLTKSQKKIDQSIKALNSSSVPLSMFHQAAKQVATAPHNEKAIAEAKRKLTYENQRLLDIPAIKVK